MPAAKPCGTSVEIRFCLHDSAEGWTSTVKFGVLCFQGVLFAVLASSSNLAGFSLTQFPSEQLKILINKLFSINQSHNVITRNRSECNKNDDYDFRLINHQNSTYMAGDVSLALQCTSDVSHWRQGTVHRWQSEMTLDRLLEMAHFIPLKHSRTFLFLLLLLFVFISCQVCYQRTHKRLWCGNRPWAKKTNNISVQHTLSCSDNCVGKWHRNISPSRGLYGFLAVSEL